MKRIASLVLIAAVALSGCASTGFLGFLATTDYVNAKTKKLEDEQAAQIDKLKAQMAEIETLKQQLQSQLSSLPKEVLKQLADAIQAYLKSQ